MAQDSPRHETIAIVDRVGSAGRAGWDHHIRMKPTRQEGDGWDRRRGESARAQECAERITGPIAAADYIRSRGAGVAGLVLAMFLDRDFNLLATDCLGQGNAVACDIKPYLLVRRGLQLGAVGFVLIQNSPDRMSKATPEEVGLTRQIRRAGEDFDIHLLNHLIVTQDRLIEVP